MYVSVLQHRPAYKDIFTLKGKAGGRAGQGGGGRGALLFRGPRNTYDPKNPNTATLATSSPA